MYSKFLNELDKILSNVATILFLGIFIINITEIICRSFLGFSLLWTVEISVIFACWMLLLGAAILFHRDDHLIVDIFSSKLSPSAGHIMKIITTVITLVLMFILLYNGLLSANTRMNMRYTILGWKMGYAYYSLPAFAFFSILFLVEKIYLLFKEHKS